MEVKMNDKIKNLNFIMEDLIPLSKYGEYYDFPSVGALRQYIFHEKKYHFQNVYKKVGNRIYISISEFNKWVIEQNGGNND